MAWPTYTLVTGATGFIGAHVVDTLLSRGFRVRGTTRSKAKGDAMLASRPQATHASLLDFLVIDDFVAPNVDLSAALEDNEAELILPAINGVKAVLSAAAAAGTVRRVVITSSFAAVLDVGRAQKASQYFTYTSRDWNPLTYEEAAGAETSAVVAYRGSKKFAELAAWEFVKNFEGRLSFDLVPPDDLWASAVANQQGKALPVARVPFWIDVRDLAEAHVEALVRREAGGKRYLVASPERFSYGMAADVIENEFPEFRRRGGEEVERQVTDESHGVDGNTAAEELGISYRVFQETSRRFGEAGCSDVTPCCPPHTHDLIDPGSMNARPNRSFPLHRC
ncbi:hypothetical protein B0T21DRAFT_416825 [Apiosordaria backusii]|uniref:NAD-dependent epimerase/dehydratase domain-containing protein n=1 Tax=Apiosordaria backusii TaxID=314023 RepID=A0AA39ZS35_9PEZI|nr:hypothetical protein B0T21DRAFT_416825 [Apiosordaria backusii]